MNELRSEDTERLNAYLRGELAAVETYRQAMNALDGDPELRGQLARCRQSHLERVEHLRFEIEMLGGRPSSSSGAWGNFAKLAEGSARIFGKKAALTVLEEGEDYGLRIYRERREGLAPRVQQFVDQRLLPEQRRTHDALSRLQALA